MNAKKMDDAMYQEWLAEVTELVEASEELDLRDLEEAPTRDFFELGMPAAAFVVAMRDVLEEA